MSKIFQILKIEDLRKKILIAALSLICFVSFINIAAAASIQDNATGGDCNLIGAWDGATKTCTLTQDVYEIIQIDSDGITLDGNGHKIIGTDDIGVYLFQRTGATVKNINVEGSIYGIYLQSSSNNTISNNVVSNNSETGLTLSDSHGNLITENEISNNQTGLEILYVVPMSDNKIYHNNFLNNNEQIYAVYDASDSFSQNPPIGGNYWSNFDESLEGCIDSNSDNFCDSPFIFNQNSQDNYPWTKQNGWKISTNQPPTIYNFNQYKSDVQTEISKGGIITENVAIFKANIIDPDGDDAKLEIELRKIDELGGGFANTATASSTYIASGATSTIAVYGLSEGQYHWQVRAVDNQGNSSQWQEFGASGNVDFEVNIPLSYKAANLAKELVNQPYLWGGKGWDMNNRLFVDTDTVKTGYNYWNPNIGNGGGVVEGNGVDCSGLTAWSYNRTNNPLKDFTSNFIKYEGADGQYKYNMQATTTSDVGLQPGDFIFFDWGKYTEGSGWSHSC